MSAPRKCPLGAFATYMTTKTSKRKSASCGRLAEVSARETGSPGVLPRRPLANCGQGRRPEALPSPVHRRLVVRVESPGEGARRHLEVHGVG